MCKIESITTAVSIWPQDGMQTVQSKIKATVVLEYTEVKMAQDIVDVDGSIMSSINHH